MFYSRASPNCNSPPREPPLGITSRSAVVAFAALYIAWFSIGRLALLSSSRLMEFNLVTTSVARPITASHPLCEESKHLPMPSGVKGPSNKTLNLSLSSKNLGHTNKSCPRPHQFQDMMGTPRFRTLQFSPGSCESSHARLAPG